LINKSFDHGIKELLDYQLPIFDDILADSQKSLSERPLLAAIYFLDHCIVDIKGDSKENFAEKEWFRTIYKLIKEWYDNRYGVVRKSGSGSITRGVLLIYKTPFELNIPLSVGQEWEGDDKRWFCISTSIQEDENILDWIKNKPNIEAMLEIDSKSLKNTVTNIAVNVRTIHVNLMTASLDHAHHKISNTIQSHLEKAAVDILSLQDGRISISYWEIHLAIEKALKLIILQNNRDHQNKHNLDKLCKIANNIKGVSLDCSEISKFPSDNEAIQQRYGEGSTYTIQEAVENYISASSLIKCLTGVLKRKYIMNDSRFLIAIPPWEK
jgi:HEPN domain-containing protein